MSMSDDYIYLLTGDTLKEFDEEMNRIIDPFITHTNRLERLVSGSGKAIHEMGMGFVNVIQRATSNPEILETAYEIAESMDQQLSYYEDFDEACRQLLQDLVEVNQSVVSLFEKMVCKQDRYLTGQRGRNPEAA
jgi:hypothetical protein